MRLTIVAATGGVGSQIPAQAIAAGHDVTAVVRSPDRFPDLPVRVVVGDLAAADPDPETPRSAVHGADAVLSGLGARSAAEVGVASWGTRAVVAAMQATGVRRIVVVSAASVGTVPSPGRPNPPRLLNRRVSGTYRTAYEQNVRAGIFISRADVAHLMLDVLVRPETVQHVIAIAY